MPSHFPGCPGLIACSPAPTPTPRIGLTIHEAQMIGEWFAVWLLIVAIALFIVVTIATWYLTRS